MEITYHLLEATYVHLYFTRGDPSQFSGGNGGAADSHTQYGQQQQLQNGGGGNGGMMHNGKSLPQMSAPARQVFQTLQSTPQNNEGLHIQNIAAISGMNVADVLKAGDELQQHGVIFTTVDDHTWAILDF